ncbi:MAG: diadenylate cyclase CdaA [Firmicutes bacterium]|nr:diadenylate cyclase CdaA [Bacillota bacterium]
MGVLLIIESLTPGQMALALLDVLLVAYIAYRVLLLIRGTRAVPILTGIIALLVATPVAKALNLYATYFLLQRVELGLVVLVPVVFQPELRRALEQLGEGRLFSTRAYGLLASGVPFLAPATPVSDRRAMLEKVARAARILSSTKTGALIAIERNTGLNDFAESGTPIDAEVSTALLVNLFVPNTPLHDGAVIIRDTRILVAGAYLPATEANLPAELGSRHRAAVGLSEQSDALVVVVSEETGTISLAQGGRLIRHLEEDRLAEIMDSFFPNVPQARPGVGVNLARTLFRRRGAREGGEQGG